jgi:hypothetical protein
MIFIKCRAGVVKRRNTNARAPSADFERRDVLSLSVSKIIVKLCPALLQRCVTLSKLLHMAGDGKKGFMRR